MSRMKVLVVLAVALAVGAAFAEQQTMQPGQQQRGMGGTTPAWNTPQAVQNLSQAVEQADANLDKAIDAAASQAKGKPIGGAFVLRPQEAGGMSEAASQGQNLTARVFVVADNQLKDVTVDAKSYKVLSTETRQMVSHPWAHREAGMGAGGSAGSSDMHGQSDSQYKSGQQQGQGSTAGQTPRERLGMPSDISMLRLETAQTILKYADQHNVTLKKVCDIAKKQAGDANVVGAFFVLPHHTSVGRATAGQDTVDNLYAKVFAIDNNQVKVMTIDCKNEKVLTTETRSTFVNPWEGRPGQSGTGGTWQKDSQKQQDSGERFPTGSGGGSGPGSLGGE